MGNRKRICTKCGKIIGYIEKCTCNNKKRIIGKSNERQDNRFYSSYKWQKLRKQIVKRDKGICQRCLAVYSRLETEDLQVHHIKSREHYLELEYDSGNLITVCRYCNLALGISDKLDFEWSNTEEDVEYYL